MAEGISFRMASLASTLIPEGSRHYLEFMCSSSLAMQSQCWEVWLGRLYMNYRREDGDMVLGMGELSFLESSWQP